MSFHPHWSSGRRKVTRCRLSVAVLLFAFGDNFLMSQAALDDQTVLETPTATVSKENGNGERAAAFIREHRSNLVFIKSKSSGGSGFIAEMKGRKILISNAHVLAHIKSPTFELLDRSPVRVGAASVAKGHDLVAFVVLEGGSGIPTSSSVDTDAAVGDAVVVLGNATGGGVVNPLRGELTGIGPDRIEISAPFERGNSGSPIVHLRTGKVIGVATYAKSDTLLSGDEKLRRFGFRLDSVKTWQLIEWNRFYTEAASAEKIENVTRELAELLSDFPTDGKKQLARSFESQAIRTALDGFYSAARNSDATDDASRRLLSSLREVCKKDVAAAKGKFSYDYFQRQLDDNELVRGEFVKAIDKVLQR